MQLHVKGKNLEVNDSIRSYVERKLQKLDRRVRERPPAT
jgi:ribosome-associated translation inhibitor RaiA